MNYEPVVRRTRDKDKWWDFLTRSPLEPESLEPEPLEPIGLFFGTTLVNQSVRWNTEKNNGN